MTAPMAIDTGVNRGQVEDDDLEGLRRAPTEYSPGTGSRRHPSHAAAGFGAAVPGAFMADDWLEPSNGPD